MKNILLLYPDQMRADFLGVAGRMPVRTPHLDGLARRGTRYTNCRSNSPLCIPMRACLTLGVRYARSGCPDNSCELDPSRRNIFHQLREAGYHVLSSGKSDIHGHKRFYDNSGWHERMGELGFTDAIDQRGKLNSARPPFDKAGPYVEYLRRTGRMQAHADDYAQRISCEPRHGDTWPTSLPREDYTDDFCGRSTLELLDRTPVGEPWALWVNFPGPHDPWDPPRELQARSDGVDFPGPVCNDSLHDHQQIRRNYAAMISGIDDWVGRIVDKITQRGELDDTLILFSSDHGEMLGDHNRWLKSHWREASVRVPLIVAGPGVASDVVDDRLVEGIDIGATMLEAAGIAPAPDADARSILGEPRPWQHSALKVDSEPEHCWEMICDGLWKYVWTPDAELLFDLTEDPDETTDVAAHNLERVREMRAHMRSVQIA